MSDSKSGVMEDMEQKSKNHGQDDLSTETKEISISPIPSASTSSADPQLKDSLFEPSVDMMVNDFDDEQTLEEEEMLAAKEQEDPNDELNDLQKEGDMPIEELLALYNYNPAQTVSSSDSGSSRKRRRRHDESDKKSSKKPATSDPIKDKDEPIENEHKTEMIIEENEKEIKKNEKEDAVVELKEDVKVKIDTKIEETINKDVNKEQDEEGEEEEIETATTNNYENQSNEADCEDETNYEDDDEPSELNKLYTENYDKDKVDVITTLLRSLSDEEDCEYSPEEDGIKKTIMVGSDYQAVIPEGLCRYDDALPYENEDKLLWDPTKLHDRNIEDYLNNFCTVLSTQNNNGNNIVSYVARGSKQLRDDEQALYLLLQCGYNCEEAIRRRRINPQLPSTPMSLWSEEECRNFENGMRAHGKYFHRIQALNVKTRSVGECVQFYYLWKKTERHDVFANKARLEKKKYILNPCVTDFMDRYLEEHEHNGGSISSTNRDRSVSPNVNNCLIFTDAKRRFESPGDTKNVHDSMKLSNKHISQLIDQSGSGNDEFKAEDE